MSNVHRLNPESVAIVAMGRSAYTYCQRAAALGGKYKISDEVWAINTMGGVIQHDLLFAMDDLKVQESRSDNSQVAEMVRWLKTHPRFFTSKAYEDYPGALEFPLEAVINNIGIAYFNNTTAYAIAFAMHIGVKQMQLFGVDFSYPDMHKAEKGRACVEYLLGVASARGIKVGLPEDTTLMDANIPVADKFYGYDADVLSLEHTDDGIRLHKTPRALPSSDEVEVRYGNKRA